LNRSRTNPKYNLKETLPIKEVRYGDVKAGGDEYGSSTVGKLECKWDYLMGMDLNIFYILDLYFFHGPYKRKKYLNPKISC